jgi:hypothetical protein
MAFWRKASIPRLMPHQQRSTRRLSHQVHSQSAAIASAIIVPRVLKEPKGKGLARRDAEAQRNKKLESACGDTEGG